MCLPVVGEKCSHGSASQQRKGKEKKRQKLKRPNDPWTCTRMRPAGCSILPPRLPSRRPSFRTTLPPIPNDPQARTTGKTGHPRRRQTRMEPLQSLETLICTTLAWATFLVSTACTPSPACSQFSLWLFPAPQTSSASLATPSPFFNYPNNFFLPTVPAPYNAMTYGSSSWSPQPGQVPLSTYSTLNGATSSHSQAPPPQPSQTNIEYVPRLPVLTVPTYSSIVVLP